MSIHYDRRNRRYRFQFDRIIAGQRVRASKLLPAGWSAAEADAYDQRESARLYAVATGAPAAEPLIDDAVLLYCEERCPQLKHGKGYIAQLAADYHHYAGRLLSELPEVAKAIMEEPVSPGTKRNRIAYIRAACRYAFKRGLGTHDPAERLILPTVHNERHVYAARSEMLRIARACDRRDVRAGIRIAFYSGMRQGEIRRARVQGDLMVVLDTKNNTPIHTVPIHPRIRTAVKYLPIDIRRSTFARIFERARAKAGLPHIHFHDLRHSTASELANAGVDLYTIGQVLGHKDPRSTKRYAHLSTETKAAALAKVGMSKIPPQKRAAG